MNVILAIVLDTWRQSLNQVVFTIMLVLFAVVGISAFILPSSYDQPDGTTRVGTVFGDGPSVMLESSWDGVYIQSQLLNAGETLDPFAEPSPEMNDAIQGAMEEVQNLDVPLSQRAAEFMAYIFAGGIFTVSMWFFIAACSGYIPQMLESGAIDIVLARPARRVKIYLGKIVGGLSLFTAALVAVYTLVFLGIGIRTGEWVFGLYKVLPLHLLTAAVLYAVLALIGLVSRSSTLCLVAGLVFYFVIDTAIGAFIQVSQLGMVEEGGWLSRVGEMMYWTVPNFGLLKANATASVVSIPVMEWQPFIVAFAWLGLALALGVWKFQRSDY